MAEKGYYLSEQLYQKLLRIVSWFDNQGVGQLRGNADPLAIDHEEHPAPEMYVAKVGIFGLHQMGDDPAVAECTVYRIVPDLSSSTGYSLEAVDGLTRQVFNMTGRTLCPGSFIEVRRDKFGSWITETAPRKFLAVIVSRTTATCDVTTGTGTSDDLDYPRYTVASVHRVAYGGVRGCESYVRDLAPYLISSSAARERNNNTVAAGTVVECEFEYYTDERSDPITGTGTGDTGPAACRIAFSFDDKQLIPPCIIPSSVAIIEPSCVSGCTVKKVSLIELIKNSNGCWYLSKRFSHSVYTNEACLETCLTGTGTVAECQPCLSPICLTMSGNQDWSGLCGETIRITLVAEDCNNTEESGITYFTGIIVKRVYLQSANLSGIYGYCDVVFNAVLIRRCTKDYYAAPVGYNWQFGCWAGIFCPDINTGCGWGFIGNPVTGMNLELGTGSDPLLPPATSGSTNCSLCYSLADTGPDTSGTWELSLGACPDDTTGTGTGDCPANIQAVCCADPVPCYLFIEFSGGSGALACLAGMTIPVTRNSALERWESVIYGSGSNTSYFYVRCNGVTGQWTIEMLNTGLGGFWPTCDLFGCNESLLVGNISGTCNPFLMFGLLADSICGAINVNVVE